MVSREVTSGPAIILSRQGSSPTSRSTGRSPSASNARATQEPMQPNAPVTSVVMARHDSTGLPAYNAARMNATRRAGAAPRKEISLMATDPRPLVVLAGNIHPDGRAVLEKEARVIVCAEETEGPFVKEAAEADGILFRVRPRCTESLMAACKKLRVVGRHG